MTLTESRRSGPAPSVDAGRTQPEGAIDPERWPDLAEPSRARLHAAVARIIMRRAVRRSGIRVERPDGSGWGVEHRPVLELADERSFFDRVGRSGQIGFGEAFMAGEWDAPDLAGLLEPMSRSLRSLVPRRLQWIRRLYEPRPAQSEDNDLGGSRRNISRHYDLSNEMFAAFLDESMTYSSALFHSPSEPLEVAQARKIDRLLDAVGVGDGTRLLEVGTGWGELALRAAGRGATVTTITLSAKQAELARRRIEMAGLSESVDVLVEDYRNVAGTYDAIVSVEMIEAVGEAWWPTYFKTLENLLAPGGRIGIQAILMRHDEMLAARSAWTWIHKYIFPGGMIPSLEAIGETLRAYTSLKVVQRQHFGPSYAKTLSLWRERFNANWAAVEALGFDQTFKRAWNYYLAYSEAGFRSERLDVAQLVLSADGAT